MQRHFVLRAPLLLAAALSCAVARASVAQQRPVGLLARELAPIFEAPRARRATWGALVVSLTHGDTLLSLHADRRFVPASNAKLFTTAAALHYLGTEFRFLTLLWADGPIEEGVLRGDLVLYGTGDPTFGRDSASLAAFADGVARAGIRRIRGDIVGDASYLGPELAGPGWAPDHLVRPYSARSSALSANENLFTLTVEPGRRPGEQARLVAEPESHGYTIRNLVVTGPRRSRTRIALHRIRDRKLIEVRGRISASRRSWSTRVPVDDPAGFAAALLRSLLLARGITATGETRSVADEASSQVAMRLASVGTLRPAPDSAPGTLLAVRFSPRLDSLVTMINHRSHNLSAELAFRAIGRAMGGAGTFASGAAAVASFLTHRAGISPEEVTVRDGSGLSLLDEASPRALVQLLAYMRGSPFGSVFMESLPVAGQSLGRMGRTAAAGRVRAKTGTLRGVSALSGYVTTEAGEELAFSVIANEASRVAWARAVQDRVGERLATFERPRSR